MDTSASLSSMLWTVLDSLEHEYAREGAGRDGIPQLDLWANLLRAIPESGIDRSELPTVLRISKRAVRTRVATAMRQGWIEQRKFDKSRAEIGLTAKGSAIASRWRSLQRAAEKAWGKHSGVVCVDRLHTS